MSRWNVRLALAAAGAVVALVAADALAGLAPQAADLTRSGQFTLTSQMVQVVGQLDADLTVTGFFRPDQLAARRDVATLLDLYRERSSHVQVRFADPGQDAGLARSLGAAAGSLVLQYRSRPAIVLDAGRESESDVTAAIERLVSAARRPSAGRPATVSATCRTLTRRPATPPPPTCSATAATRPSRWRWRSRRSRPRATSWSSWARPGR